jgi:hypothetical protein
MSAFDPLRTLAGLRQNTQMSRWIPVLLALGVGVAVPAAYSVLHSVLAQRPLALGSDVDLVTVLIVAFPYLLLSLLGVRSWLPWIVSLALTVSVWAKWLHSTVTYQWHPDGSGADFGSLFLIYGSPVIISVAAFAVDAVQQWRCAHR